jgi:hypothetical protein
MRKVCAKRKVEILKNSQRKKKAKEKLKKNNAHTEQR